LVRARVHEYNIRYDRPDGELQDAHQVLRLRKDDEAHITIKGPTELKDGLFRREEIEFTLDDYEAAKKLFEALGYQAVMTNEKFRTTYSLWGLLWMLDEKPLGSFLEIEGQEIQAAAQRLGLNWEAHLQHGYTKLFARSKKGLGLDFRDLTFANFEGVTVSADDLGTFPADVER
jgi:adenylate cyclase class IV